MAEIRVYDTETGEVIYSRDLDSCLREVRQRVDKLCADYTYKYGKNPKFVKIPQWLHSPITLSNNIMYWANNGSYGTIWGLNLCPTESISEISEIEVF